MREDARSLENRTACTAEEKHLASSRTCHAGYRPEPLDCRGQSQMTTLASWNECPDILNEQLRNCTPWSELPCPEAEVAHPSLHVMSSGMSTSPVMSAHVQESRHAREWISPFHGPRTTGTMYIIKPILREFESRMRHVQHGCLRLERCCSPPLHRRSEWIGVTGLAVDA